MACRAACWTWRTACGGGRSVDPPHPGELAGHLLAPLRLEPGWPAPPEPLPVGGGWVHAEVIDDDRDLLDRLLTDAGASDPEAFARTCQELRLPVSPYRALTATTPAIDPADPLGTDPHRGPAGGADAGPDGHGDPAATGPDGHGDPAADRGDDRGLADPAGATVIDLSTHWAGPLATRLLADAGATVVKVDPRCRPDGFGQRPALYRHLNHGKEVVDLDLRSPTDRARFEQLLASADLLVESFSRRVMGNLGYDDDRLRAAQPRPGPPRRQGLSPGLCRAGLAGLRARHPRRLRAGPRRPRHQTRVGAGGLRRPAVRPAGRGGGPVAAGPPATPPRGRGQPPGVGGAAAPAGRRPGPEGSRRWLNPCAST